MGFWGKLGKGLLKAAPIAAAFIPGVGPIASMAISAGIKGATNKIQGGSWKSALGNAGLGALEGLGPKGIGPSGSMLGKVTGKIGGIVGGGGVGSAAGGGWKDALSGVLKNSVGNVMGGMGQGGGQPQMQGMPQQQMMPQVQPQMNRRRGLAPSGGIGNAFARGASQVQAY